LWWGNSGVDVQSLAFLGTWAITLSGVGSPRGWLSRHDEAVLLLIAEVLGEDFAGLDLCGLRSGISRHGIGKQTATKSS